MLQKNVPLPEKTYNAKPKLKVWTAEISTNLKHLRSATKLWINEGKPRDPNQESLIMKGNVKRISVGVIELSSLNVNLKIK